MRVFKLTSGSWAEEYEFEGSTEKGRLGGGILGVTMTGDGSALATGSTRAATNGLVEAFHFGWSSQPSESPSAAPTLSGAPSAAPSVSNAPSQKTSVVSTQNKFAWDLVRLGDAAVAFSADASESEIVLNYNISIRETNIQVFQFDCNTIVPPEEVSLNGTISEFSPVSTTHQNLTIRVDIKQDAVIGSGIWSDGETDGVGTISMCIRVDLTLDDENKTSVTFHEQKLDLTIGLLQGFEVTGIDLNRTEASNEDGTGNFDYELTACQCDEASVCVPEGTLLTQGEDVFICVETEAPDVEIERIQSLRMNQGTFDQFPIINGVEGPLTSVSYTTNRKEASIRYQLISRFFEDPTPQSIIANGTALLAFTDNTGGRRLLRAKLVERALAEPNLVDRALSSDSESFAVTVELAAGVEETSSAAGRGILSMTIIMVGSLIALA
jgi:hypothetical protein